MTYYPPPSNATKWQRYSTQELADLLKSGVEISTSYSIAITEKMHDLFGELFEGHSAIHGDDAFAQENGFDERVCYSYMTIALLAQMIRAFLPDGNGLCYSISTDFLKPVYIGDTLLYTGILTKIRKSVRHICVEVIVTNQYDETVAKASLSFVPTRIRKKDY